MPLSTPKRRRLEKMAINMTPMIDVVFQLLIFFMLTLKIIEPEGDFNINMPIGAPSQATSPDINLPDIKVRLIANSEGQLADLQLGRTSLGNGPDAFKSLNSQILNLIGGVNNPLTKDMEVEIDADYNLHYDYVVQAISSCRGRLDAKGKLIPYIEKIKFAPPRRPDGEPAT